MADLKILQGKTLNCPKCNAATPFLAKFSASGWCDLASQTVAEYDEFEIDESEKVQCKACHAHIPLEKVLTKNGVVLDEEPDE